MPLQIFCCRAILPPMYALGIAVFLFAALPVSARSGLWQTEIDNNLVRVVRRSVTPDETIAVPDSSPGLFVFLTDRPVRIMIPGRRDEIRARRGYCFWHPGGTISLKNPGGQPVDIAWLLPKFPPDPSVQLPPPANPRAVEFENELLRVWRIGPPSSGGGNAVGKPHHPASSVMVGADEEQALAVGSVGVDGNHRHALGDGGIDVVVREVRALAEMRTPVGFCL
jgi:hypothetical protein